MALDQVKRSGVQLSAENHSINCTHFQGISYGFLYRHDPLTLIPITRGDAQYRQFG
jgi:hypothetical protein